jgi:hypothetical protein
MQRWPNTNNPNGGAQTELIMHTLLYQVKSQQSVSTVLHCQTFCPQSAAKQIPTNATSVLL